ncbi:MAG: alpha/beta hydrolase [Chloroflexi bacterium]|nr:alpha/beta hydrolase [Chloroflexota bacterium]
MPMINLPHAHLFYALHQPEDACHTLLLIHGAGGSHLVWPAALRRLPNTAVYAIDLAGHGRSNPPGYDSIQLYARDVLDFITALGLQKVVLLGHSMGGAVAQMAGLMQSPAVAGLVLLGTGAKLRVADIIFETIQSDYEKAVDQLNQFYWGSSQDPELVAASRKSMLACPSEVMFADFTACNQFDVRSRLPELTYPTLVISGSADQMTPPKFGRFLADNLPQATFALIGEGGHMMAGHMMALEFPEQVAQHVAVFLKTL